MKSERRQHPRAPVDLRCLLTVLAPDAGAPSSWLADHLSARITVISCEGACLVTRAAAAHNAAVGSTVAIRLEVARTGIRIPAEIVWIAPGLDDEPSKIGIQLRPALADSRSRTTFARWIVETITNHRRRRRG